MRLVAGEGSLERREACWMSAVSYYVGNQWTDHPDCVCLVIRNLCIALNDALPDGRREELIGPHIFAPVGTANERLLVPRAYRCADWAVREIAPRALRGAGFAAEADRLMGLDPIVDESSALPAEAAANAAKAAWAAADAAYEAYAADAAWRAAKAAWAAKAADAADAAWRAAAANPDDIHRSWLSLILELCAMGDRVEVVPQRTQAEVLELIDGGSR